jgi:hypothetical protein
MKATTIGVSSISVVIVFLTGTQLVVLHSDFDGMDTAPRLGPTDVACLVPRLLLPLQDDHFSVRPSGKFKTGSGPTSDRRIFVGRLRRACVV